MKRRYSKRHQNRKFQEELNSLLVGQSTSESSSENDLCSDEKITPSSTKMVKTENSANNIEINANNSPSNSVLSNLSPLHSSSNHSSSSASINSGRNSNMSSSSNSSEGDINNSGNSNNENNFISGLAAWAISNNIPHTALNGLLKLLTTSTEELKYLPLDARTILKSPRTLECKVVEPGLYYHFGLETKLLQFFAKSDILKYIKDSHIDICINIDGLPISKSSGNQLYPILFNFYCCPNLVGIIGIYQGNEKPSQANDLLHDFILEAKTLITAGITFRDKKYSLNIKAFICDAPAKSYVLQITGHTGYFSCSKCHVKGSYQRNRICFPCDNFINRTDTEFRNKSDLAHHTGTSMIEELPGFDLVENIVLDYMHLICLGVMKKLLVLWCFDTKSGSKLSRNQLLKISEFLNEQRSNIPVEFNRRPRSLKEVKRWKAVEYRQFLFYTGPVILQKVLPRNLYTHFLSLFISCVILSKKSFSGAINNAKNLLKYFVNVFGEIYGVHNVSHNVHNLLHLSDDVEKMGVLDLFSSFPFENKLQKIKNLLRNGNKPLPQIVKRLVEIDASLFNAHHKQMPDKTFIKGRPHNEGPLIENTSSPQYLEINFKTFKLTNSEPNNCCSLKDGKQLCIQNFATLNNNNLCMIATELLVKEDLFKEPCNSSELSIYKAKLYGPPAIYKLEEIQCKCVKLSSSDGFYAVIPLLHT